MSIEGANTAGIPQLAQTKQSVDTFLDTFCEQQIIRAKVISPAYAELWEVMRSYFAAGGKRIRPHLTILAYDACGGSSDNDVLAPAVAWELLHGCMLMHDDIIDRDYMRHGQPNISGTYKRLYSPSIDAGHYADGTALIAGDLALSAAYKVVMESRLDDTAKHLMHQQLENAMFMVAGGELLDVQATLGNPETTDTMTIARTKTAEYSFCGPLQSGALLANASEHAQAALHEFGIAIGTAYQLADDLLGIIGEESRTGKPTDSDIREGKRTEILRQTYLRLDSSSKSVLDAALQKGRAMSTKDVETVRELIQTSGSLEVIQSEIATFELQARHIVAAMPFRKEYRQTFENLIDSFLHRNT